MTETPATQWFSAKVRLVCLIEPAGAVRYMDAVYVFQSIDFQTAFHKALEIGKCQEKSYVNAEKNKVVWRLVAILSLDVLMAESLDGVEVYSEPAALAQGESFPFDATFHPEQSEPTQTI